MVEDLVLHFIASSFIIGQACSLAELVMPKGLLLVAEEGVASSCLQVEAFIRLE
jgi:hypothetical protein